MTQAFHGGGFARPIELTQIKRHRGVNLRGGKEGR